MSKKKLSQAPGAAARRGRGAEERRFVAGVVRELSGAAEADAANVVAYLRDVGMAPPVGTETPRGTPEHAAVPAVSFQSLQRNTRQSKRSPVGQHMARTMQTLGTMYALSTAADADASSTLTDAALALTLDVASLPAGTHQRFRWDRTARAWTLREYASPRAALYEARFPTRTIVVRHSVRVGILDAVLSHPRDLTELRRRIVAWLGTTPATSHPGPDASPQVDVDEPPPLTAAESRVLEQIRAVQSGQGITGGEIIAELRRRSFPLDQSTLTRHVIPNLKRWHGVRNRRGVGYYIAAIARPR